MSIKANTEAGRDFIENARLNVAIKALYDVKNANHDEFGQIADAAIERIVDVALDRLSNAVPRKCAESGSEVITRKCDLLRQTLLDIQKARYHEPNSDYYERCNGCGRSPYNTPRHAEGCLVPKIDVVLKATE
jgi:hypothetical protein